MTSTLSTIRSKDNY